MYQPFEFEGAPTPLAADLLGQLNTTEERRGWLIRAAVVNAALADEVERQLISTLPGSADDLALVIIVAEALGSRRVANRLAELGLDYDDCLLAEANRLRPGETNGIGLARFVSSAASASLPAVKQFKQRGLRRTVLGTQMWAHLSQLEFEAAIDEVPSAIAARPEIASAMGTRIALMHSDRAVEICGHLIELPLATRLSFGGALEKHLRRIFQIRVWVECRTLLFSPGEYGRDVKKPGRN